MADKSKNTLFGLSPAHFGIASLIAGCLAFGIVWVIFNQGPDSAFNNHISSVAIHLLLLFGVVCGVLGVGAGFFHKKWFGIVTGAVGLAMSGYGASLVMGF